VYTLLVITSTLLSALFLLALYPLLKRRFFPSSPVAQYRDALAARQRSEEIAELAEELVDTEVAEPEDYQPGQGIGLGIDLSKAKEGLGLGGAGSQLGVEVSDLVGDAGKKGERKRKLRERLRAFEEEYGAGTVVVLGDLAVSNPSFSFGTTRLTLS